MIYGTLSTSTLKYNSFDGSTSAPNCNIFGDSKIALNCNIFLKFFFYVNSSTSVANY